MAPSFSATLGSGKNNDDNEDDSSLSRLSPFSTSILPHMPKIPNVSQVTERISEVSQASEVTKEVAKEAASEVISTVNSFFSKNKNDVTIESQVTKEAAKEAAPEVISTVNSFFSKNKNDVTTESQAPNTLSSINSQLPGLSHISEFVSTTDLPSTTIKKNGSTYSQAQDVLSSITIQTPQIPQVTEVSNPSIVVSSTTSSLNTIKNDNSVTNSTQFNTPKVLSSVISNLPNVSETPTASKDELKFASSVSKITSSIPKIPVIPNTSEGISTAASFIGTSMEYDNAQSLLGQCSLPDLSKMPQTSQTPQISEVASLVTSQIPHVPEVVPSIATSIGALNEVNKTQSLLPTFSQPQLLQKPKVPQVPQVPQIPQGLAVPQFPQFPDAVTSSTPLLGASGIPKDAAISFLKQILTEYLSSPTQQKAVVGLVLLNLARSLIGISINFIENHSGGYLEDFTFIFEGIRSLLGMLGFMISNAFVVEQVINFWTFGWRNHLASPYNVLDSLVTVITFASSLLPNTINEFASLLAILRLWRLFKRVGSTIPNLNPTRFLSNSYV